MGKSYCWTFWQIDRKGAEIGYNFQNLEIDVPKAVGQQGHDLGSAKWAINGRVVITAQAYNNDLK